MCTKYECVISHSPFDENRNAVWLHFTCGTLTVCLDLVTTQLKCSFSVESK